MRNLVFLILLFSVTSNAQHRRMMAFSAYDWRTAPPIPIDAYLVNPEADGLVKNTVTDTVSKINRDNLLSVISTKVAEGYSKIMIPNGEYYFWGSGADERDTKLVMDQGLKITTSNFTLMGMGDTQLKIQPNDATTYSLITVYLADNVTFENLKIYGSKYEHDFTTYSGVPYDWGHCLSFIGSHNSIVKNCLITEAISDGIYVRQDVLRNPDGTLQAHNKTTDNLLVTNCVIDNNGRTGLGIVDTDGMIIEYCQISNTAVNIGTPTRCGIDFESFRERDSETGVLSEWQKVSNCIVRYNSFFGNVNQDILLYTCNNVQIHNNTFTKGIYTTAAYNIEIYDNHFEAEVPDTGYGIRLDQLTVTATGERLNYNFEVRNNYIEGYEYGFSASADSITSYGNKMVDNYEIGLSIGSTRHSTFTRDTITSTIVTADGIRNSYFATNPVSIVADSLYSNVTGEDALILQNCNATGTGVTFTNSVFIGGKDDVDIKNSSNITVDATNTYTVVEQSGNTNVIID